MVRRPLMDPADLSRRLAHPGRRDSVASRVQAERLIPTTVRVAEQIVLDPRQKPAIYQDWVIDAVLEAVAKERERCQLACNKGDAVPEVGHFF